jgi:hypothetical protein
MFLVFLVLNSSKTYSQDVVIRYSYDEAGNRKLKEIPPPQKIENINDPFLNEASKTTSITDNTFNSQVIRIFPNPTNGIFEIEIPDDTENPANILIYIVDINGKLIVNKPRQSARTILDISNQPGGIYFLNLKKGDVVSQWKIIKQQ